MHRALRQFALVIMLAMFASTLAAGAGRHFRVAGTTGRRQRQMTATFLHYAHAHSTICAPGRLNCGR